MTKLWRLNSNNRIDSCVSCPGRGAARSDATQTRDPGYFLLQREQATGVPDLRCTASCSAFALHGVRDTGRRLSAAWSEVDCVARGLPRIALRSIRATIADVGKIVMRYAIVIEKAEGNYSAYVPDLPGCVATGATVPEVEQDMREAIRFHIDGLKEEGLPVPQPTSIAEYVEA